MFDASSLPPVPRGVSVVWNDGHTAEVYRAPAVRGPRSITVRHTRAGLTGASGAGVGGASGGALLLQYGVTHARPLVTLAGVALAVVSGVLLDRLAGRLFNRTELRFTDDALELRTRPIGDPRPQRIAYAELAGFEVEEVVESLSVPPVVLRQVNARRRDGSVETVFAAVDSADTAAWLCDALRTHALGR